MLSSSHAPLFENGKGYWSSSRLTFVLLTACVLLLSACQPPAICREAPGCVWIPPDEPIVLGVLYTWLGREASTGNATLTGIRRAIEEREILLGHRLVLKRAGSECTPESARIGTTALLTEANLFLVFGPTCPSEIPAITPLLEDAGVFLVTPLPGEEAAYRQTQQTLDLLEQIALAGRDGTLYLPRRELQNWLQPMP